MTEHIRITPGPCAIALGRILVAAHARPLPVDATILARHAKAERRWRRRALAFVRPGIAPVREAAIRAALAAGASVLDVVNEMDVGAGTVRQVQKAAKRDRHALKLLRVLGNEIGGEG
jgi:hypothetical protein